MSILKSEINLKGTKPNYLRTTKNLYSHFVNGKQLFFSYYTLVAIDDLISVNNWSVSTGKHLTWINPDKSIRVKDFDEQARAILEAEGLISSYDHLKTISNISSLFAFMSNPKTEAEQRKVNNQRLRFYETQSGIIRPNDWDCLTVEDQTARLDKVDEFNKG